MTQPTSILELPDGLHAGIEESVYYARIPGVASKSVLELVDRAPAHYAAWLKGADREDSDALRFGKAFHCALLEPHVYDRTYAVEPKFGDCRKPDNKKRRDEWRAENDGRQLLEQADATAIVGMARSIRNHPLAGRMLQEGASELTVKWTDPETGIICKSRADSFDRGLAMCVDVKTTEDARPGPFAKSVANYGYYKQAALYTDGFAAVDAPIEQFVFLCVEKRNPFLVGLYHLDDDALTRGREWSRRTLGLFAECIEFDRWPGYSDSIETLSLPRWAS